VGINQPEPTAMQDAQKFEFIIILIRCFGITLFALIVWHFTLMAMLAGELDANAGHKLFIHHKLAEIALLKEHKLFITKAETELHFIASVRNQNVQAASTLSGLGIALPDTVSFQYLKRHDQAIIFDGTAKSDLDLIHFMENIMKTQVFMQPVIVGVSAQNEVGARKFQLQISLR
jgi:hypothetical protein